MGVRGGWGEGAGIKECREKQTWKGWTISESNMFCWCSFANLNSRIGQLKTLIVRVKSFKHNLDMNHYFHCLPPHYLLVQTPPGWADVIFYSLEKALGCLLGCLTSNLWGFTNTTHTFVPKINSTYKYSKCVQVFMKPKNAIGWYLHKALVH